MASFSIHSLLLILLLTTQLSCFIIADELDDDIDLADLDLEDPEPADSTSTSSSTASSLVSSALQKRALVQLSDQTAAAFLDSNAYVLLLGFAPWCHRSSELMPEFAAAALQIQEAGVPVVLARLDAIANPKSASLYGIKGFPTLLFFTNGTALRYTGGQTRNDIMVWAKKHSGTPVTSVSSKTHAEEILKQGRTVVVGFFKLFEGPEYDAFASVAIDEDETEFVQVSDTTTATVFNAGKENSPPFISIIKNEPETYVPFEDTFTKNNIKWFVEVNKHPLVTKIDHNNYMRLYNSPLKRQVTLYTNKESADSFLQLFQDVASLFKGQILFLLADTADEELSRPTLTLYGLDANKPVVTAFNYEDGSKYLLESSITYESLMIFCQQLIAGELQLYYKSQPVPEQTKDGVQVVVGKTFESIVFDSSRDVFLEVYTEWCARYEAGNKAMDAIAKHFKDVPSLVVAKIDAGANEHPLLQVEDYPSFLFYPANNKNNPVRAPKRWTTQKLIQLVQEHATVPLTSPVRQEKDEL